MLLQFRLLKHSLSTHYHGSTQPRGLTVHWVGKYCSHLGLLPQYLNLFIECFVSCNQYLYRSWLLLYKTFYLERFGLKPIISSKTHIWNKVICHYLTLDNSQIILRSKLLVLLGRNFSDVWFNVVLVNKFTVGSFFNYTDKLPMRLKSSLVYKFSCAQCASEYVGMTARTLGIRVDEHVGVSYRTGARLI